MELVATEGDLMALAARIRAAKADLKEAHRIRGHAETDLKAADAAVRAAKDRVCAARGALIAAAGANDDDFMMW